MEKTALPSFNRLMEEVESFLAGHLQADAVLPALDRVDAELGGVLAHFERELPFQEETKLLEELVPVVYRQMDELRELLPGLRTCLAEPDRVRAGLGRCAASVDALFGAFQRLRDEEASRPRLSQAPAAHELLRVGQAYLRGRLPLQALQSRFDWFLEVHERLALAVESLPGEEAHLPELDRALDLQQQGLDEIGHYLDGGSEQQLREGLDRVRRGADALVEAQRRIEELRDRTATRLCPWCSHENAVHERFCAHCGASLPGPVVERNAGLDVREGEPEPGPGEHLERLAEAVEGLQAGRVSADSFEETLADLESRCQRAVRRFERLEPPPDGVPSDHLELHGRARAVVSAGLSEMESALAMLREIWERGDLAGLQVPLQSVLAAGQSMGRLQLLWEEAQERFG